MVPFICVIFLNLNSKILCYSVPKPRSKQACPLYCSMTYASTKAPENSHLVCPPHGQIWKVVLSRHWMVFQHHQHTCLWNPIMRSGREEHRFHVGRSTWRTDWGGDQKDCILYGYCNAVILKLHSNMSVDLEG